MPVTYKIKDFITDEVLTGSSFTGNEVCDSDSGDVWDGRFVGENSTWWATSGSIGGMQRAANVAIFESPPGTYQLALKCCSADTCQNAIWIGDKEDGTTPEGVYWRANGSDMRDRIVVFEA